MALDRRAFLGAAGLFTGLGGFDEADAAPLVGPYPRPTYVPDPPGTVWFAPSIPAYPQPLPPERLIADAQRLSDALEAYVVRWLEGRAPDQVPDDVLPPGYNRKDFPRWRLVAPEAIASDAQWIVRPAHPIDRTSLHGSFPDPNCTYAVAPLFAPFGSSLRIEGQFPHARFFDLQVTPSFDPKSYRYDGWAGVGEVPLVDADIPPAPGSTNPFLPGARRDGAARDYAVEIDFAIGDPVVLNAAFRPPTFRGVHRRVGGAIMYQGPYADPRGEGHKRGRWDIGWLWLRYYRPDTDKGPLGGVPLPRLGYTLRDGRRFWLQADAASFTARANAVRAPRPTSPAVTRFAGPNVGWYKQAGILRAIYSGFALEANWAPKSYVRAFDRGVSARADDLAAPNNYEQSATSCTYIDYIVRGMQCPAGSVVVLTGRLPKTPRTREGDRIMTRGEARYWSLTGYAVPEGWDMLAAFTDPNYPAGLAAHCVMDEDVVLQTDRWYVLALSRPEDRPVNARAEAGVTWADWGLAGNISWTLRWMSVAPDWIAPFAPTPQLLGRRSEWAEDAYDPNVLPNRHDGALGPYLPRVHLMPRAAFEALEPRVEARAMPAWV